MSVEVLGIVFHFGITLFVIAGYVYTVLTGHPDETLKTAVFAILAYWFGALNQSKLSNLSNLKNTQSTEVKKDESTNGFL